MAETDEADTTRQAPPGERSTIKREVSLVFGLSAVLTAGLVLLGRAVPFVGQNVVALVALVFLYLPVLALRRRGLDAGDFGLDRALLVRGARLGLLITLITLPPFLIGFHLWETVVFEQRLDPALDNYRSLPEGLRIEPTDTSAEGLYLWRRSRHLVVKWTGDGQWSLELETDGELIYRGGSRPTADAPENDRVEATAASRWQLSRSGPGELVLLVRDAGQLDIEASRDGELLGPDDVWSEGAFGSIEAADPIELDRSINWLLLSLVVQVLLVALPEEFFYRGYLQTRIDSLAPTRWRFGPFHTSPAILTTSLLFAVGHFIIGFDPVRLSVFFPSLVFGWLKDRSGGLGACILYHAACNLMVEVTVVHYWP